MKTLLIILSACGTVLFVSSCDRSTPPPPLPTPSPTPVVRLAPEGILYVTERFSVPTDSGLHGFSVGKQVKLIRIDGSNYIVSDGQVEATAPTTSFTNDLDILDALVSRSAIQRKTQEQRLQENANESKRTKELLDAQRKQDLRVARLKQLDLWIYNAETQIKLIQEEISHRRGYSQSTPEHRERLAKIRDLNNCISEWRNEKYKQ
jgi:hypothetical protein